MTVEFELAQVNIGRPLAPLDDPKLAGFVRRLEGVNALAEASPGFVWRLQGDAGDATSIAVFEDPSLIINMSTWRSVQELKDFVFTGFHAEVMRRRREWFEHFRDAYTVAWWVPAGHRPSVQDAEDRLLLYRRVGGSQESFALNRPYPPPGQDGTGQDGTDQSRPV